MGGLTDVDCFFLQCIVWQVDLYVRYAYLAIKFLSEGEMCFCKIPELNLWKENQISHALHYAL